MVTMNKGTSTFFFAIVFAAVAPASGVVWAQSPAVGCVSAQERAESDRKIEHMTDGFDMERIGRTMTEASEEHARALDAVVKCRSTLLGSIDIACNSEISQADAAAIKYNTALGQLEAYKTMAQSQAISRSLQRPVCR